MRETRLRSFNDYREAYGLSRLAGFDELTSDTDVRQRLEALYGDIDKLEWYVGIFAEDYPDYMRMGELMSYMVANDAFTQALTNPLLARNVFNEATFTKHRDENPQGARAQYRRSWSGTPLAHLRST